MKHAAGCLGRISVVISISVIAGLLATPAHAQSSTGRSAAFEVASIRPAGTQEVDVEGNSRAKIEYTADSLTMRNIDLSEMVQWAYSLEHYQVLGPAMLEGQRYDIRARAAGETTVGTLRAMLQNLLATRFKMQIHHAEKGISVYQLVVAKGGPRLPKDKDGMLPSSYPKELFPRVVDGSFVFNNVSMAEFAEQLTHLRGIELPVVDRTGIQGTYDITLKSAASAILEANGPSLLSLIQEQLGLKLVSGKEPIEIVVVDHAEKPTDN